MFNQSLICLLQNEWRLWFRNPSGWPVYKLMLRSLLVGGVIVPFLVFLWLLSGFAPIQLDALHGYFHHLKHIEYVRIIYCFWLLLTFCLHLTHSYDPGENNPSDIFAILNNTKEIEIFVQTPISYRIIFFSKLVKRMAISASVALGLLLLTPWLMLISGSLTPLTAYLIASIPIILYSACLACWYITLSSYITQLYYSLEKYWRAFDLIAQTYSYSMLTGFILLVTNPWGLRNIILSRYTEIFLHFSFPEQIFWPTRILLLDQRAIIFNYSISIIFLLLTLVILSPIFRKSVQKYPQNSWLFLRTSQQIIKGKKRPHRKLKFKAGQALNLCQKELRLHRYSIKSSLISSLLIALIFSLLGVSPDLHSQAKDLSIIHLLKASLCGLGIVAGSGLTYNLISREESQEWLKTAPINHHSIRRYKLIISLIWSWILILPQAVPAQIIDGSGFVLLGVFFWATTSQAILQFWNSRLGQLAPILPAVGIVVLADRYLFTLQFLSAILWLLCAGTIGTESLGALGQWAGGIALGLFAIAAWRVHCTKPFP